MQMMPTLGDHWHAEAKLLHQGFGPAARRQNSTIAGKHTPVGHYGCNAALVQSDVQRLRLQDTPAFSLQHAREIGHVAAGIE